MKFRVKITPYTKDGDIKYYIGVGKNITEERNLAEKLSKVITYDPITNLLNRNSFVERVEQHLKHTSTGLTGAMCVVNPLRFSEINEALGFDAGNAVLRAIAKRLKNLIKSNDIAGKLESDKFAVYIGFLRDEQEALLRIVKLMEELYFPYSTSSEQINIFFNVGVSLYPQDSLNAEGLLEKAQIALIDAKSKGKNALGFYTEQLKKEAGKKLKLKAQIKQALRKREFVLHYQPYFDIAKGNIAGVEALIRWQKEGKLIPLLEFIPYLEEIKMISEIEEWTTEEVPSKLSKWLRRGIKVVPISINISPESFRDRSFVSGIVSKTHNLPEGFVNIEIVERLFMEHTNYTKEILDFLRKRGFGIFMDDFGTGYSSLSYISNLPIDCIKIDISFIRKMLEDKNTRTVIKTIIFMARDLGIKTVAEGVETEEQLKELKKMGCDYAQGYLLSKPLTEEELLKLLAKKQ